MRRAPAIFVTIACAVACGELLSVSPEEVGVGPDSAIDPDAAGGDGAGGDAADGGTEGGPPCAIDCRPGVCAGGTCASFLVIPGVPGSPVVGVAALDDRVFYSITEQGHVGVRIFAADQEVLFGNEDHPRAVHVVAGKLQWVNARGLTGEPGLRESNFDGTLAGSVGNFDAGCADIISTGTTVFHYSLLDSGEITRRDTAAPELVLATDATNGSSLAKIGDKLVWTKGNTIAVGGAAGGGSIGVNVNAPVTGITAAGPWIYFTTAAGDLGRIHSDGSAQALVRKAPKAPQSMGAVAVSPSEKVAYWVEDGNVVGLAISP